VSDVADLLTRSWAAHQRYRSNTRDRQASALAITEASDLRRQAHEADPEHASPEWATDVARHKTTHQALLNFYERYLA
jgi:hypothetical protein